MLKQDEIGCALSRETSRAVTTTEEAPSSASFRPLKQQRFGEANPSSLGGGKFCRMESKPTSAAITDSLKRLQKNAMSEDSSAATVLGIYRLSRCQNQWFICPLGSSVITALGWNIDLVFSWHPSLLLIALISVSFYFIDSMTDSQCSQYPLVMITRSEDE